MKDTNAPLNNPYATINIYWSTLNVYDYPDKHVYSFYAVYILYPVLILQLALKTVLNVIINFLP